MAIYNGAPSPGHDYKVLVTVAKPRDMSNNWLDPILRFQCKVRIKYVSDTIDASITQHYPSSSFQLPIDELTWDDNFSSHQPQNFISNMLCLMKIPFNLDRLFLRTSIQDDKSVPLKNFANIVSHIFDAARVIADEIGVRGKSNVLVVMIEKIVTVPYDEFVKLKMSMAKRQDLFCTIEDQNVTLRPSKTQRQNHSISTMKLRESSYKHEQPPPPLASAPSTHASMLSN